MDIFPTFLEQPQVLEALRLLSIVGVLSVSVFAAVHAMIYKRDSWAATSWVALILFSPVVGAILYYFFGINRLQRRILRHDFDKLESVDNKQFIDTFGEALVNQQKMVEERCRHRWKGVIGTGDLLSYSPLFTDSRIRPLNTGDEAYPEMLKAIAKARQSITLLSYIFADDLVGREFMDALIDANQRGVEVRVLYDAVGSHRSYMMWGRVPNNRSFKVEPFHSIIFKTSLSNLRNHRKLLIIDGRIAFTGGLNIAKDYWPSRTNRPVIDLHFKVEGQAVNYLQQVFVEDWHFSCGETLAGELWFHRDRSATASGISRVIDTGPSVQTERLHWHFLSAINAARESIKIVTPYFLPNAGLTSGLCSAALRGVVVDIIVPKKSDHFYFNWAIRGSLWELLAKGCRVWFSPPPFDHSKVMVVDGEMVSFGSANWDQRSIRLNFELNMEVFSRSLAQDILALIEEKQAGSSEYTLKDLQGRPLVVKAVDGFSRLFSPYL